MHKQNEEDIVVRKKMYLIWLTNLTSCCVCLWWWIPSLHIDISHLSQLSETKGDMPGVVWAPLRPGAAAASHIWQRFMELFIWSGLCCTGRTTAQDRRTEPWHGQDRRLVFLSLHRGQTTCTQGLTDAWAQAGNWCNPGGSDRGNCLSPHPHIFLHHSPRNKA